MSRAIYISFLPNKSENFLLTLLPPHPLRSAERSTELTPKSHDEALSPVGERGRVRGNFKYFWLGFLFFSFRTREVSPRKAEKRI